MAIVVVCWQFLPWWQSLNREWATEYDSWGYRNRFLFENGWFATLSSPRSQFQNTRQLIWTFCHRTVWPVYVCPDVCGSCVTAECLYIILVHRKVVVREIGSLTLTPFNSSHIQLKKTEILSCGDSTWMSMIRPCCSFDIHIYFGLI